MRHLIFFVFAVLALAQDESIFRTTTQLVQIDVAAEDKDGKPVAGLTKDDFELFVGKKPQEIATFTATSIAPAAPITLPPGTFSNKQAATEVTQGRYTVFLLDWRNTNWQLQSWAHQELLKMLSKLPEGSKAALYVNNNGLQIAQEFTSDHELIKAKAATLWGQLQAPESGIDAAELAAKQTVAAFQAVAKHLAGISGQKVLIWVSTGFPDHAVPPPPPPGTMPIEVKHSSASAVGFSQDIDNAVRLLGNANIVVESAESTYLFAHVLPETGRTTSYVNTLQMIAERTGGRFYPGDTNDFASTLLTAANDRATSYELGYYAGETLQPGLQPFEIECKRPGVTLRYREGYYIDNKPPAAPTDTRVIAQDVLEGAVDAVAIPLTASATHTMGNMPSIMVRLNIDATALALRHDFNLWRGRIAVFARFASDEDDQLGDVPVDAGTLTFTDDQHTSLLRDGLVRRFTMKLPQGATTLRVLVRDEGSGNMGTVTIPVTDLPEF
jgi:VWFA-related protein